MQSFRQNFFQILLLLLALAFTLCIRYLAASETAAVGAFAEAEHSNITISDIFDNSTEERQPK